MEEEGTIDGNLDETEKWPPHLCTACRGPSAPVRGCGLAERVGELEGTCGAAEVSFPP